MKKLSTPGPPKSKYIKSSDAKKAGASVPTSASGRSRKSQSTSKCYGTLWYPDSGYSLDMLRDKLSSAGAFGFISPLHDLDEFPHDAEDFELEVYSYPGTGIIWPAPADLSAFCLPSPIHAGDYLSGLWFLRTLCTFDEWKTFGLKKPHRHICIKWPWPVTKKSADCFFTSLRCVGCEPLVSWPGAVAYLTHLNAPHKHQYSDMDVLSVGGAVLEVERIERVSADSVLMEIVGWCAENQCFYFNQLVDFSIRFRPDWFKVLTGRGASFIRSYMMSMQADARQGQSDFDSARLAGLVCSAVSRLESEADRYRDNADTMSAFIHTFEEV